PDQSVVETGFFQEMIKAECQYLNGTEQVRLVMRYMYNREQFMHFDSYVGLFVADTPMGECQANYYNSHPDLLELTRAEEDMFCRHNYKVFTPFTMER
ncbi:HB2L protein, partial [Baryphthengus martii]|nr:HB2L protein [Baryphthengus martii]